MPNRITERTRVRRNEDAQGYEAGNIRLLRLRLAKRF
ncbi:MAG: hypothetical protein RL115_50 [Bacteroidota bacterium]|jgi:hypothetical protein